MGFTGQKREAPLRPREALASSSRDLHHPTWDAAGSVPGSLTGANTAPKQAHVPARPLRGEWARLPGRLEEGPRDPERLR